MYAKVMEVENIVTNVSVEDDTAHRWLAALSLNTCVLEAASHHYIHECQKAGIISHLLMSVMSLEKKGMSVEGASGKEIISSCRLQTETL